MESAQTQLEDTVLRAPFAGIVTAVEAQTGENVGTEAIITLADLDHPLIELYLDETDVPQITIGQEAQVSVDAFPNVELTGEVTHIAPVATTQSGVVLYPVTVRLSPTDLPMRAGMTSDAEIVTTSQEDTLIVPLRAVHTEGDQAYVYRLVGDQTEQVEVALGLMTDTEVEITSGLSEGDVVSVVAAPTQGPTERGFGPGGIFGGGED